MPVSISAIANLLFPGLAAVTGQYELIERQYSEIFDYRRSEMELERIVEARFLGPAQLKTEGAATQYDNNAGQRFTWNQEHTEVALGYAITRKAIADNLYKSQFQPSNLGLMNSFLQTKENFAANVLNTANVVNTNVGGDGKALLDPNHPVDGSVYANTPSVQVDLNEASLLSLMIQIRRQFVDQANLKFKARARKLVVPPELEPIAIRLLQTELRPGTGDNDVNAIRSTAGGLPDKYMVNDYLTSTFVWFLLTNVKGLNYMEREPFETDMQIDFNTDNLQVKGYERYSFSWSNPRAIAGSMPTS